MSGLLAVSSPRRVALPAKGRRERKKKWRRRKKKKKKKKKLDTVDETVVVTPGAACSSKQEVPFLTSPAGAPRRPSFSPCRPFSLVPPLRPLVPLLALSTV